VREVRLKPEKITHPFQLMAAWFVMLILLVGVLLTGAARIDSPKWIPAFLVISCVGLSILVMAAVFVMLTRFRPHLQGAKEYFEWLKDERRFRIQTVQTVEVRQTEGTVLEAPTAGSRRVRRRRSRDRTTTTFQVANLEGVDEVLGALSRLGFHANIFKRYEDDEPGDESYEEKSESTTIWVGSKVSPHVAALAIKTVVKIWPHLRYMSIPGDLGEEPPEEIHYQIFFGGATNTAISDGLIKWTQTEIEAIPDQLSPENFHKLIRAKYPTK
jgi:hypothetical protein